MITRRTRLRRSTKPVKRSPVKRKNRSSAEFRRIYGSRERVAFVKNLPCVYCLSLMPILGETSKGISHNAHTETGGMGRKAHYTTIIPLCPSHHKRYDEHRSPMDDSDVRRGLKACAANVEKLWQEHLQSTGWRAA